MEIASFLFLEVSSLGTPQGERWRTSPWETPAVEHPQAQQRQRLQAEQQEVQAEQQCDTGEMCIMSHDVQHTHVSCVLWTWTLNGMCRNGPILGPDLERMGKTVSLDGHLSAQMGHFLTPML